MEPAPIGSPEPIGAHKTYSETPSPTNGSDEGPASMHPGPPDTTASEGFDALLDRAEREDNSLPACYRDFALLKVAPYRRKSFRGMKRTELLERFPFLEKVADTCLQRSIRKLDPEMGGAFETEEAEHEHTVPRRHVGGSRMDAQCSNLSPPCR